MVERMQGWLYILKGRNNKYYVGSTTNLTRRLKKHRSGQVYSTKRIGDIRLVFRQKYLTYTQARRAEIWIKKYKKRKLIDKIIAEGNIKKEF